MSLAEDDNAQMAHDAATIQGVLPSIDDSLTPPVKEGVKLSVPYWIANERDLGTEMPEIELGPVADWRVLGLDESRHGAAQAIRDVISETVDVDYRSHRVDDPADRGVEYDR